MKECLEDAPMVSTVSQLNGEAFSCDNPLGYKLPRGSLKEELLIWDSLSALVSLCDSIVAKSTALKWWLLT